MNIKDCLHYYIGQNFLYGYLNPIQYTLKGIFPNKARSVNPADYLSVICIDPDGQWDEMSIDDHFKLILRRLENITEQEAIELIKLTEWHHYGTHPFSRQYETYRNSFGQIVVKWGDHPRCFNVPVTKEVFRPEEFHYLLQQGFDLWGLIDAGNAIDLKTIS